MNLILLLVILVSKFITGESYINATALSSFPPLFALEEWAKCQEPGDVYCIVVGTLSSSHPSPLLDAIKEHSSDELRHYNRSYIHRGVCISRHGADGPPDRAETAQRYLNQNIVEYGLEAKVRAVHSCSSAGQAAWHVSTAYLACCGLLLGLLAALGTGLHAFGDRCGNLGGNKYVLAFSLKRNWDILMHDKPGSDSRMKQFAYVEILRFTGLMTVILSHVVFLYLPVYKDNPEFIENMHESFLGVAFFNLPVCLQAFFSISGLIMAYSICLSTEKQPFTLKKCVLYIINRWVRLTPVSLFVVCANMSVAPLLSAGPQWTYFIESEARLCARAWWEHALYFNNLPKDYMCMAHTWYIAADLQLYAAGVLVLWVATRWRWAAGALLALLLGGVMAAGAAIALRYHLLPLATVPVPDLFHKGALSSKEVVMLYMPAWPNSPGYITGFATAFILYHVETRGIYLHESKWFRAAWASSPLLAAGVVLAGAPLSGPGAPRGAVVAYVAADRTLFAIFFSVFLLGLVSSHAPRGRGAETGAPARTSPFQFFCIFCLGLMSQCKALLLLCSEVCPVALLLDTAGWHGWQVLGRLTFSAYVLHFTVMRVYLAIGVQLLHISLYSIIFQVCTTLVITYLLAVPVCLLIELPIIHFWKAITSARNIEKNNQKSAI